jgi:hypothetical protein
MNERFTTGVQLGEHAAGDNLRLFHGGNLAECEPAHDVAVGTFDAGNVGEEDEGVGFGADGAGCGHLVCVDVVVLAIEAEGDGGDDGNRAHSPDGFEPFGVHGGNLAYEAEVGVGFFLAGAEDVAVAAGEANCGLSVRADGGDEGFVDAASKDHEGGIASFCVGDAQAGDELAFLSHEGQGAGELHASTMDHGYLISIGDEVGDGFATGVEDLFVLKRGTAQFDYKSHSKPSSSFHPHIRLRFCTA